MIFNLRFRLSFMAILHDLFTDMRFILAMAFLLAALVVFTGGQIEPRASLVVIT